MAASRFLLKTAPPRLGRSLPVRPRLEQLWSDINDRTAILVTAPQGYGKTTLLAQWRRRWLERGALVAWMTFDSQDERAEFVELLGFALRSATGRDAFEVAAMQGRLQEGREIEALTALLAETAALATPTVLVLDDAHRMPQAALASMLTYLLNNAPANLQFVVCSRKPLGLGLGDLVCAGQLADVGVDDLRLGAEETRAVLRARFGDKVGLDAAAHLHGLAEGWPLGLQLAMSAMEHAADPETTIRDLRTRRGGIQRAFFDSMFASLAPDDAAFFVRSAILESMNAELGAAVTGHADAARALEVAVRDTPLATQAEVAGWVRLHAMVRDFLLGQFDRLPEDERRACHERAAAWYAAHGQLQDAAQHAWSAGNESLAVSYAKNCLREIAAEGRLGEARDWTRRIPAPVVVRDADLLINAAWVRALGDSPQGVPEMIDRLRRESALDERQRFEAALAESAAAIFCDRPALIAEALRGWPTPPDWALPLHVVAMRNSQAILALHSGLPSRARELLVPCLAATPREPVLRLALGFSDAAVGLSHLWEGNPLRAAAHLQPVLADAEREMGRRGVVASIHAGVLSAAKFLLGDLDGAASLLAGRLDVVERTGMPDAIVMAYRCIAEGAMLSGDDARALEAYEALRAVGAARGLPRLELVSLTGQAVLHARSSRVEIGAECLAAAEALWPTLDRAGYTSSRHPLELRLATTAAALYLARGDASAAATALEPQGLPAALGRSPDALTSRALRAVAMYRLGRPGAQDVLAEALSLAELGGMRWYVEAAHPDVAGMLGEAGSSIAGRRDVGESAAPAHRASPVQKQASAGNGLLTPKEAQILSLLATGMANKEIARAMDIGEQTVKWHLKNVFFKLSAASRRHAVDRARLLGLLSA